MHFVHHKSVLTALIVAVLAIGGCLPCQKLFAGRPSKNSCCNAKGQCQKPTRESPGKNTCNLQLADMQAEPQLHSGSMIDASLTDASQQVVEFVPVSFFVQKAPGTTNTDSSPPPLFLLNLRLLI